MFLDHWFLQAANHWVARSDAAFYQALSLSERSSWVWAACAFVALWFTGDPNPSESQSARLSRLECRRRVLLLALALPLSFLLAQVIQKYVDRPRPLFSAELEIPIDPEVWQGIKGAFSMHGSFPSDHAVMFAVIITGVFSVNVWAGLLALVIGLYYSVLRVGVGFHWPSDVVAGGLLGTLVTGLLLFIKPALLKILDFMLLQFERYQVVTYPVGFLMLLDLSQKLSTLFYYVALVLGHEVEH